MIKHFVYFMILLIASQSVIVGQSYNQYDAEGNRHGLWKKYYDDSKQLRYQGEFDHGKEVGVFKFYSSKSGDQPTALKSYTVGSDTLDVVFFTPEGKKVSQGPMIGRKRVGDWVFYHQDGQTVMIEEQYEDDLLNGEQRTYYINETLAKSIPFVSGKEDGKAQYYSENGIILQELSYENGELQGKAVFYDQNGVIEREGRYKDNRKHGTWKYYSNGQLTKEIRFPQAGLVDDN